MGELRVEVDVFETAARWVTDKVGSVPADAWNRPGLGDWDVRALVGHTSRALLTVEQYLARRAESEDVESPEGYYEMAGRLSGVDPAAVSQRGVDAGASLGSDPATAFAEISERVIALLSDQPDELMTTIVGGIRLSNYLPTRTFELVVHGLDLAVAAGLPTDPPATAQRRALELASSLTVLEGQGPSVLLALTGRKQLVSGFSLL